MIAERVFRILWGPTLENVLDFAWPTVGADPMFWRDPRPQSQLVPNGANAIAWITGRRYCLRFTAKYFGGAQNFGATGLQAFLDWATEASNTFTLVPNIALPTLTVTGCYLDDPFMQPAAQQEQDSTQSCEMTIVHPTVDLGLAWRGLFFEYTAGGSIVDPTVFTFTRASIAYEIGPDGYLHQVANGVLTDGHYPGGIAGDGLQTTQLGPVVANDVTNPEDLSNASWDKTNNVTVTANKAAAPDQNVTADLVVETVTNGIHCIASNAITIASGDVQTALLFVRSGGRYKGAVYFGDGIGAAPTNRFGVSWDLLAGTISATQDLGAGALAASKIIPLSGGWFMIWIRGALNAGVTSSFLNLRLFDGTGAGSYAGDAASGTYFWGVTAVHGATNSVANYAPVSSATDSLAANGALASVPPQASWFYIKLVECGAIFAPGSTFPSPLTLGNFTAPNWRTIFYISGNQYAFSNGNSVAQVIKTTTSAPTVGQVLELLGLVFSDGSVKLLWAIASGAEQATTQSAAPATPIPATYNTNNVLMGGSGYGVDTHQIAVVRFGPLVTTGPAAVLNIATARGA